MNKHQQHVRGLIALAAAVAVIIAGLVVWNLIEEQQANELADDGSPYVPLSSADFTRNGRAYRLRSDLTTILLIGHDKDDDEFVGFADGGQADFLLLLVVDNNRELVTMLQIDRDTMARVNTVGATGRSAGGKVMQICLAHAYGNTVEKNDANTREAVAEWLGGIRIDYTVSMGMDGIGRINHLLGGVTVTVEDDMTAFDPAFYPGNTVRLTDEQAFLFCHSRQRVGDGRNTSRMHRQKLFMESAAHTVQERVAASGSFAEQLLDGMMSLTNMMDGNGEPAAKGWFINQLNKASTFTVSQPYTIPGEHVYNETTKYIECWVDPDDILDWVIKNLCYEV